MRIEWKERSIDKRGASKEIWIKPKFWELFIMVPRYITIATKSMKVLRDSNQVAKNKDSLRGNVFFLKSNSHTKIFYKLPLRIHMKKVSQEIND